eukprot:4743345-Pleurochrysis_carterae.AAC.1
MPCRCYWMYEQGNRHQAPSQDKTNSKSIDLCYPTSFDGVRGRGLVTADVARPKDSQPLVSVRKRGLTFGIGQE